MAAYPRGNRPRRPFPYFNEVMTGFEYTAAVHMLYEGQLDAGLRCIGAIRERYDGRRRSPFDEAECGHHYARAMASWAAVLALSGFHYSGVDQALEFAGADQARQIFWANGYAWGTCAIEPATGGAAVALTVLHGTLTLRQLGLAGVGASTFETPRTIGPGETISVQIQS
jgi:hypothetical protein